MIKFLEELEAFEKIRTEEKMINKMCRKLELDPVDFKFLMEHLNRRVYDNRNKDTK